MPRRNHPRKRKTIYRKSTQRPRETYRDDGEYGF